MNSNPLISNSIPQVKHIPIIYKYSSGMKSKVDWIISGINSMSKFSETIQIMINILTHNIEITYNNISVIGMLNLYLIEFINANTDVIIIT